MQAIILAAGMGKRLKELTSNNTKCMVKVNGVALIDRVLHQLENINLSRILIVVGYESQKLIDFIETLDIKTPITFINNPIYDKTNNIYSLALAKDWLCKEDTLLLESDLIFEDSILSALIDDPRDTLALVDKYESWMDGTCVKINENDEIESFVPGSKFKYEEKDEYYKTVNVYKFSKNFSEKCYVPFLEAYQSALGENEYYEQVLRVITMLENSEIKAKRLNGELWYEIDDIQDLDIASTMFMPNDEQKLSAMHSRYGGFWRYPKLIDFCYLVNPYFPPKRMFDEIKASAETILTQYPSGMRVNSLLAGRNFGVRQENIVVGNGAAELIRVLMRIISGKLGVIRPTFEEYANSYNTEDVIEFWPNNDSFSYSADDIISYFSKNKIDNLVLVNPDNPTGNYIPKKDLFKLIEWAEKSNIKLIIDESFVDFADEENATIIEQDILNNYKNLLVMKSISKSYGVPGLRLGVLASGDIELINLMKKNVSIWNINSFAEFYMQIEEKYKKDYAAAMKKFREERRRYITLLNEISGIRVIPTQANYVMVELTNGMNAEELNTILMNKYDILIKNLVPKIKINDKQYVRLAIRNTDDNNKLIAALKEIIV